MRSVFRMPDTAQIAARIRAARAYADIKQPELAKHMGYSTRTWVRVERGTKPLDDAAELVKVAEFCQVPIGFMHHGFARSDEATGRIEAVYALLREHHSASLELRDRAYHDVLTHIEAIERRLDDFVSPRPLVDVATALDDLEVLVEQAVQRALETGGAEPDAPQEGTGR